jgi:hypothetical protein
MDHRDEGGPARVARPTEDFLHGPAGQALGLLATAAYEPAAVGDTALIPYEKADRIPAALQHLEAMTSDLLGIAPHWFVSLLGAIEDKGSVALFGEVRQPGSGPEFRLYRVVSYDTRTSKFTHVSRHDRAHAERLYDQRREELS